jgi:hypothetical membrane protein
VVGPLAYFAGILAGVATYPGYDLKTQYASELGASGAPHPELFNDAIIFGGALGVISAAGFFTALCRRRAGWLSAGLAALSIAAWGASMIFGGLFPMPDPRHGGFGLGLLIQLGPLFFLWALARTRGLGLFKVFLAIDFVATNALFAIMMGMGHLVHRADVGLWQHAFALTMMPWITIAALVLMSDAGVRKADRAAVASAA